MSGALAASALEWWRDAGVDTIVAETPRNWLAQASEAAPEAEASGAGARRTDALPGDIASFSAWLLESPDVPLAEPPARRVGPLGDPATDLMVMIAMPASGDALLAGEPGAMLERMMRAIGRDLGSIYLAPLSVVRAPTGRLRPEEATALAPIARHHIGLVRPRALLLFGDECALALTGAPAIRARQRWHDVETPAGPVRAIATMSPQFLVRQPARRREVWEDLQMLMEGLKA
jgi:uracil-DNA glycosylase family 4